MLSIEPDPVLRSPAQPVMAVNAKISRLARDMIETMYANDGIGIAAPQVGESFQLFVANPWRERGKELVVLNPVIESSRGRVLGTEGCLSLPGVWGRVRRAASLRMSGQNLQGRRFTLRADGLLAVVLQHEFDHLQGKLFVDRLSWLQRRRLARQLKTFTACA